LAFGIAIGAYWQEAFLPYIGIILAIGIVSAVYIISIKLRK
jgi:hypothetical protein